MGKHIQVREVGHALHAKAKGRAAHLGMSLSDYVKALIEEDTSRLTIEEWKARVRASGHPPVDLGNAAVEMIREDRNSH